MTPSFSAINARGLKKNFGALAAVKDISFQVHPGEIFGLVGPDGAGKTTTMRMLAGIMDPDESTFWAVRRSDRVRKYKFLRRFI